MRPTVSPSTVTSALSTRCATARIARWSYHGRPRPVEPASAQPWYAPLVAPGSNPLAPLVGLTGGIASGKSTVAAQLAALGVPVVDADAVAREVVAPGSEGLRRIAERFGEEVLRGGDLDRERLGAIVFADEQARADLEGIVHPLVAARSAELLRRARSRPGVPYVVYEVPLLVEKGLAERMGMDAVVVVDVPEAVQLRRLLARDGLEEQEALARIRAQASREARRAAADFVIDNAGSPEATATQVRAVHAALLDRFGRSRR